MTQTPVTFIVGDVARYHGDVQGNGLNIVVAGDEVTVCIGNLNDPEDDVWVMREQGAPIPVSAHDLEWLQGKA